MYLSFTAWLLSLSIISSKFTNVVANGKNEKKIILFYGWVVSHIYMQHLHYPFICWWTLGSLPYLAYCECCCNEHRNASISLRCWFQLFWIYSEMEMFDNMVVFFERPSWCSPQLLCYFTLLPTVCTGTIFSMSSLIVTVFVFFPLGFFFPRLVIVS